MIGEKLFCGLDVGSQRLKASLTRFRKSSLFEVVAAVDGPTRGLKNDSVTDLAELAESIQSCCQELMKKAGGRFKEVRLGLSGHGVYTRLSRAVIPLSERGDKVITTSDIEKVIKDACLLGIRMEEEILHRFSLHYILDDQHTVANPLGLHGHKLETQLLLIISKDDVLKNVMKAVNQAGFEVASVDYSSYAAARATLEKKQGKEGCVFIDVGASMTSLLIFKEGQLQQLELIPRGGNEITLAIAENLNLPFDLAEEIKKSYAGALAEEAVQKEEILVRRESAYVPVRRELIYQAIEPKIKNLVQCISDTLKASAIFKEHSGDMVMVGGGALLPGLIELIEQKMNVRLKMGKLTIASNSLHNPAIFSAVVGLAMGSQPAGGASLSPAEQQKGLKTIAHRLKELYYEYF